MQEGAEKILSLVDRVLENELMLEQAEELLSSDQFKFYLNEKVLNELEEETIQLMRQSPQTAYILSVLCYKISKMIDNSRSVARWGFTLGLALIHVGQFRDSIPVLEQVLAFFKEEHDKQAIGSILGNLGSAYFYLGDFSRAVEYYNQALEIHKELKDPEGEASALVNLGNTYWSLADYYRAINYHRRALDILQSIADPEREAIALSSLGNAYWSLGEYSKAIVHYERALQMHQRVGDRIGEGATTSSLGNVYWSLGEYSKAIAHYERALHIHQTVGDRNREGATLGNLGNAYWSLGHYKKATEYHHQALEIFRQLEDLQAVGHDLGNLGIDFNSLGDYVKAIEYSQQALEISREWRDRQAEAKHLLNLGGAYFSLGEYHKSIDYYRQALKIDREIGTIDSERMCLANLGMVYDQGLKQNGVAYHYYKQSIELAEKIRGGMSQEEHKSSYLAESVRVYDLMLLLCNRMGCEHKEKLAESFEYLERSKSRTFLESLAHTNLKPSGNVSIDLVKSENHLLQRMRVLYLTGSQQGRISLKEIENLESELNEVWNQMEKIDPEYVSMRRGRSLNFSQIRQLLRSQGEKFCLVEYFVGSDKILIFILPSDKTELKTQEIDISYQQFSYYVKKYFEELCYFGDHDLGQSWQNLSRCLIGPILEHLDAADTIYFVPHRATHYLPLHSLRHNGQYLIERYKIAYSPSASVISYCQKKRKPVRSDFNNLVLGAGRSDDSDHLRCLIEEEANRVAEILIGNSVVYKGEQVNKDLVQKESRGKHIIHFSCHGFFHPQMPMKSGLILGNDEILTVEDIFQLELDADLVTLSACQTGINEQKPGDDLVGLTRACIYAGTPSVIVSLWSVATDSTIQLMERFYGYLKEAKTKVEALQKAQLAIMNHPEHPEWRHPYYWAPFILVGDWK